MWKSRATVAWLLFGLFVTTTPGCRWIRGEKPTVLKQIEEAVPAIQKAAEAGTRTADSMTELVDFVHEKMVWVWIALSGALFTFLKTGLRLVLKRLSGRGRSSSGGSLFSGL